ncbi:methylmalonyl-CoA mutase family protein [Limimaricola cinnabarinus]|uniref:methylmalonyl-CoA mutase family protein n=1 Tax=Limimaricola cinnabarinus TaxID=1125964 RepID=UPI002FE2D94E
MTKPSPLPRPKDGPAPIRLRPDLPTRAGFDSDHPLACGLVGREGPAIAHRGDLAALLARPAAGPVVIDADATGPWLLAMLVALAETWPGGTGALRGALCNDALDLYRGPAAPSWSSEAALDLAADTLSWSRRALPGLRGARLRVAAPVEGDALRPLVAALHSGLALLAATARRERPQHLRAAATGVEFLMPGNGPGDRAAGALLSQLWRALLAERHGPGFALPEDLVLYPDGRDAPGFAEAAVPGCDALRAALSQRETAEGAAAWLSRPAATMTPPSAPQEIDAGRNAALARWRRERDGNAVQKSLLALREAAKRGINVMGPSVACAKAGVTTGEWAATLGGALPRAAAPAPAPAPAPVTAPAPRGERMAACARLDAAMRGLSRPMTMLLVRPGLDARPWSGHPLLRAAQDCGVSLCDCGARRMPAEIVPLAYRDKPHVLIFGLSNAQSIRMANSTVMELQKAGFGPIPMLGLVAFDAAPPLLGELHESVTLRNIHETTAETFLDDLSHMVVSGNALPRRHPT